jgi:integrase
MNDKRKRKRPRLRPKIAISRQVTQHGTWWCVRPRVQAIVNGEVKTVQRSIRLALVDQDHPDRKSVEKIAEAEVDKLSDSLVGRKLKPVAAGIKLNDFVNQIFLPSLKKKPSTINSYRQIWTAYLEPLCGDAWLKEVRCVDITNWLTSIFDEHGLRRSTLRHIKHLLSGIYKHAKAKGYFDKESPVPVKDAAIPDDAEESQETFAYTLTEVFGFMRLPEPGATIAATAAFSGLRLGEIRGLQWPDFQPAQDEDQMGVLHVRRSVWRSIATAPKSRASRATVPMIRQLQARLEDYRAQCGSPANGPIFANGRGRPLDVAGYWRRSILPILRRCSVCKESEHAESDHKYVRDESMPVWRGFHAFRRGIATNLHELGLSDKTTQRILRHSDVSVTQSCYIKPRDEEAVAGMRELSEHIDQHINQLEAEFRARVGAQNDNEPEVSVQ